MCKLNGARPVNNITLCFTSIYAISGIWMLFRGIFSGATRIITKKTFAPELQLCLIEKYKVMMTMNAPYQLVSLMKCDRFLKSDLSSYRMAWVGGANVPLHIQIEMKKCLPNVSVVNSYGMCETVAIYTCEYPVASGKDTVGQLGDGIVVKIINEDGKRCGINQDGEVCVKLNYRFLGYYGNQSATDELIDLEGYIKSGDIGHFDEDGYLYIIDRKKDIFRFCNIQVCPSQVDAYLIESPHIKSACLVDVFDVKAATDLPAAFIVRAEGSNISEKDIFDMVAGMFCRTEKFILLIFFTIISITFR